MKININIDADPRVKEKLKYGFTILFQPLRAEIVFTEAAQENGINIFYGKESLSVRQDAFHLNASDELEDCIRNSKLPDISGIDWFEFSGKKLPKIFPVSNSEINFDIAAAGFMLASEFQDLISLERDEFDRFRAMDSLQDKLGILDFPVVNYYSMLLKRKLGDFFGVNIEAKKYGNADHGLALTHDIDYTSSLNFRMIKRNLFGHAILNNEGLTPVQRGKKLLYPLMAIAGNDPPRRGLNLLRDIESERGLKSTFFVKTGATAKQDVNYNHRSPSFRRFLDSLIDKGFEIGIHPSMKTYVDGKPLISEKTRLEEAIRKEVHSVRQHYLKFTSSKTVGVWEEAGLKYDSTLGFSRRAGFRNSVAFPFPLYNFGKDRTSTVIELPLLIMDGTFADTRSLTSEETFEKMRNLVHSTKAASGAAAILFHNSISDPIDFPDYEAIYDRLLTEAEEDGFRADTLAGIIEDFR
jgi:hypothetical protein